MAFHNLVLGKFPLLHKEKVIDIKIEIQFLNRINSKHQFVCTPPNTAIDYSRSQKQFLIWNYPPPPFYGLLHEINALYLAPKNIPDNMKLIFLDLYSA